MTTLPLIGAARSRVLERVRSAMDGGALLVPPPDFAVEVAPMPYAAALAEVTELHDRQVVGRESPLQVYVHVPLCEEHCNFCMYFYGLAGRTGRRQGWTAAQVARLMASTTGGQVRPAAALYIGGGTPSVLDLSQMEVLLAAMAAAHPREPGGRFSMEMSPRSASVEKIRLAAAHGVNRFSFGVQSTTPSVVASFDREPTSTAWLSSLVDASLDAGARDVNVDLMHGIDGQPADDLIESVRSVTAMGVPSITIYRHRPLRFENLDRRGGAAAFLHRQTELVARAVAVAGEAGYRHSTPLGAESVRLRNEQHLAAGSGLAPRHWYYTQYDPLVDNHLLGYGSGAQSFAGGQLRFVCEHLSDFVTPLAQRPVKVWRAPARTVPVLTAVRELYWKQRVDGAELRDLFGGWDLVDALGEELAVLDSLGAVAISDDLVEVACSVDEWALYEKLLYPAHWLEGALRRAGCS